MGLKTEELMNTCRKAAATFKPLVEVIDAKLTKLNQRFDSLKKKAVPEKGEKLLRKNDARDWQAELTEIRSNRVDLAKHIDMLRNGALRDAAATAKELEGKVKKKDFLNFFKSQQSLDEAKKALKESQQAIGRTEERLTELNAAYSEFDDSYDRLADLLKKSLKEGVDDGTAQELTDQLERQLNKTIPNGLLMLKNVQAVLDKKADLIKKLQSDIGKTKNWTPDTRQTLKNQIGEEIAALTKIIDNVPIVMGKMQLSWTEIRKTPRNILNLPAVKPLLKKAEITEASAMTQGSTLLGKLEAARVELLELQKDVAAAGNDDNHEAIEESVRNIEQFTVVFGDSPTGRREDHINDGKRELQYLLALAKRPMAATEDDRKRLNSILLNYGPAGKLGTQQWADSLSRGNRAVEAMVNRFKKNADIQSAYKEFKPVYQRNKKLTETFVKLEDEIYKRASQLADALP
jgi:hypothetical protein